MPEPDFAAALRQVVAACVSPGAQIAALRRLSGGASQETWSFDAVGGLEAKTMPLILRRAPGGARREAGTTAVALETEAKAISAAAAEGVPVPRVRHVMSREDGVGSAYIMDRLDGETIARRILRDSAFDAVRPALARQCGRILARIHRADTARIPELTTVDGLAQLKQYRDIYDSYAHPHPVFELAFRWIADRLPPAPRLTLVHGDFRNGNLLIAPDGVRAVLDWELVHRGDPLEDLGWICVNSWRFGITERPVGGFGSVEDLLLGYAEEGGADATPEAVRVWEAFGSLKWGVMCMTMVQAWRTGHDRSVERAAIGRRASEAEIDLVNLMFGDRR